MNTTLEQDGKTLLHLAYAFGKDEKWLRRGNGYDVSLWHRVKVEGGRVTRVVWFSEGFSGTIPKEISVLSALTHFDIAHNNLTGCLPPELGELTSLTYLSVNNNYFRGLIPSSLANLTKLEYLFLGSNTFINEAPHSDIIKNNEVKATA